MRLRVLAGAIWGNVAVALTATFGASRSHPVFQRCPALLTFLNLSQVESASAPGSTEEDIATAHRYAEASREALAKYDTRQ
jgi:hypothetical protein